MSNIKRLIKKNNEFLTIPLAIFLLWISVPVLRWLDPTAATFDFGVIQKPLLAIVFFGIIKGAAWGFFQLAFPELKKYLDNHFEQAVLSQLKPQQLCGLLAFYFLFYLFCLVLLTLAI